MPDYEHLDEQGVRDAQKRAYDNRVSTIQSLESELATCRHEVAKLEGIAEDAVARARTRIGEIERDLPGIKRERDALAGEETGGDA